MGARAHRRAQAWPVATGKGITIAIADTGVDLSQQDLVGHLVPGYNVLRPGSPPQDDNGHGTELAGIAAAVTNNGVGIAGVAPDASIMPIKVLDSSGEGDVASVGLGIEWAAAHGAKVINLSLGDLQPGEVAPALTAAIDDAWRRGAICVVAAGNTPLSTSGFTDQPAVVVGALGRNNAPVGYSSTIGPDPWGISAPGGQDDGTATDDILSTFWLPGGSKPGSTSNYAFEAGTSMATAFASGALADLLSMGLTPTQAVDRLLASATPLGDRNRFGAGALDLSRAVLGVTTDGSSRPAVVAAPRGVPPRRAIPGPAPATVPALRVPAPRPGTSVAVGRPELLAVSNPHVVGRRDDGIPAALATLLLAVAIASAKQSLRRRPGAATFPTPKS